MVTKKVEEDNIDYKKLYLDSINKAKEYIDADPDNTLSVNARGIMFYLFPQLEESEDERIRKAILAWMHSYFDVNPSNKILTPRTNELQKWYNWLEDQKETKELTKEELEKKEVKKYIKNILRVLEAQKCWEGSICNVYNPYEAEIDWLTKYL